MSEVIILGVAGGSGSGKTFFARDLHQSLGLDVSALIYQDNFYFDQSAKFDFDGGSVNFDHPSAIDFNLLAEKLLSLKSNLVTEIPVYDFATHKRKVETITVEPRPVILVDGILIAFSEPVRKLCNKLIYFNTSEELRFQRRLARDVKERGRTEDGVRDQFYKQVKPMHDQYVEPSRAYADLVVSDDSDYQSILSQLIESLKISKE